MATFMFVYHIDAILVYFWKCHWCQGTNKYFIKTAVVTFIIVVAFIIIVMNIAVVVAIIIAVVVAILVVGIIIVAGIVIIVAQVIVRIFKNKLDYPLHFLKNHF